LALLQYIPQANQGATIFSFIVGKRGAARRQRRDADGRHDALGNIFLRITLRMTTGWTIRTRRGRAGERAGV